MAEGDVEGAAGAGGSEGGRSGDGKRRELAGGRVVVDHPSGAVARITLCNPEKRNALDHAVLAAIAEAVGELDDGISTRCVILTGSDGSFSAGYDIGDISDEGFADEAESLVAHPFHQALEALSSHRWPTVAAINGHCLGGGLELALCCDLRLAQTGAKLGMPPAKLGLVYSHTGLRRFIDTIGAAHTKQLFLTGENVESDRAVEIGLVGEVVDPEQIEDRSLELAAHVAAAAPLSLTGNKRIIDTLVAEPELDEATEGELMQLRVDSFHSEDLREGITAFGEKRPPRWRGR